VDKAKPNRSRATVMTEIEIGEEEEKIDTRMVVEDKCGSEWKIVDDTCKILRFNHSLLVFAASLKRGECVVYYQLSDHYHRNLSSYSKNAHSCNPLLQ
jgi:hypothetical protein